MCNTTPDKFKKAIKAQYEIEKVGQYSKFLQSPTQANLRKLCWERFKENSNTDDLSVFRTFFEFDFSTAKRNQLKEQTDRFRPIRAFFLGITEFPTDETIELAAVLVDFELRPYNKFRRSIEAQDPTREDVTPDPPPVISTPEQTDTPDSPPVNPPRVNPFRKWMHFIGRLFKRSKRTAVTVAIIFGLIGTGTAIYFIFFNKGCMQWSDNHYEVVDCKDGIEGNQNKIILYDSHLLDFKKIAVCDTTTWYANGESIVWYAKIKSKVDFFNSCGNGRHPETNSTLRPLTDYMFKKHKSKDCASK